MFLLVVLMLLVVGVFIFYGLFYLMELVFVVVFGVLLGDGLWYFVGKCYGWYVMVLLCCVFLLFDLCVWCMCI